MFHVEQQTASDVSFDFLVKIELSNLYDVRDTRRNHQTRNDLKVRRLKCLHYGTVAPCNVPLEQNLITRFVLFFLSLPKVSVQRKELIVVPFCEYSVWITFFESPPHEKKKPVKITSNTDFELYWAWWECLRRNSIDWRLLTEPFRCTRVDEYRQVWRFPRQRIQFTARCLNRKSGEAIIKYYVRKNC